MQESSLHAALKNYYTRPGDLQESPVAGYQIDVVSGDLLIEIQTGNFTAMKAKLPNLLADHPVLLVHPIPLEKWIIRMDESGEGTISRRKSPRRGRLEHLFFELVRIPTLIQHPNFALDVLLVREEEVRRNDGKGSWRRGGWSVADHRLLEVVEKHTFRTPQDFQRLIPAELPQPFTTRQLAAAIKQPRYLAAKMIYCLRTLGLVEQQGKRGRSYLYICTPF